MSFKRTIEEVRAVIEVHIEGTVGSRLPSEHVRTRMRTVPGRWPFRRHPKTYDAAQRLL